MKKYENRWTFNDHPRLIHHDYKGAERKKYWTDTIRHYDQKRMSFFVTNVLANRKISVPLR